MSEEEKRIQEGFLAQKSLSDEAIDWLVRLSAGRPSPQERLAFRQWRARSPAHEAAAAEAEVILGGIVRTRQAERLRSDGATVPFPHLSPKVGRRLALTGALAASAAAVAVALPALTPLSSLYADYATSVGERRRITLPDGSIATLNTASALSVDYTDSRRRLVLHDGEALFEVGRDSGRPFIVAAGALEVQAVGTRFVVDLVRPAESVIVLEGTVDVTKKGNARPMRVDAGQCLDSRDAGEVSDIDLTAAAAWSRGKLIFNRRPLQAVADELQRYRSGRVVIARADLKALRVTGVFDLDDPDRLPDDLLRAVGEATGLRVVSLPLLTVIY